MSEVAASSRDTPFCSSPGISVRYKGEAEGQLKVIKGFRAIQPREADYAHPSGGRILAVSMTPRAAYAPRNTARHPFSGELQRSTILSERSARGRHCGCALAVFPHESRPGLVRYQKVTTGRAAQFPHSRSGISCEFSAYDHENHGCKRAQCQGCW